MISNRDFNNTKTAENKTKTKAGSYNLLKLLFADINITRRLVTASRSRITTSSSSFIHLFHQSICSKTDSKIEYNI